MRCFLYGTLDSSPVISDNNYITPIVKKSLVSHNTTDKSVISTQPNVIYVSQIGYDGFGHQLHGLLTIMAFNGIRNYKFVNVNTERRFAHIRKNKDLTKLMNNYLTEAGLKYENENGALDSSKFETGLQKIHYNTRF